MVFLGLGLGVGVGTKEAVREHRESIKGSEHDNKKTGFIRHRVAN